MSGRSAHRVWLASIRLSACPSVWIISVRDAPGSRKEEWEEEERDVKGSNQSFCGRMSSSSAADETSGSCISPRCCCSRWVVRLYVVWSQTCILSFLSFLLLLLLLSSVIHFTLLARVLSARDVVPMGSSGCVPPLPPPDELGDTFQHLGDFLPPSSQLRAILLFWCQKKVSVSLPYSPASEIITQFS